MRILVVDDDATFRGQFGEFLESTGHQVATEPNAAKALARAKDEEFDLVFTDLRMPRESGLDLLKELRRDAPRTLVVLVTGYATVPSAVEAMKGGAFDYLTKPFRAEQVESILRLVEAERAYTDSILPSRDPYEVARTLARQGRRVLVLGELPPPVPARIEVLAFDGIDLARAKTAVEGFLHDPAPGGVVLPDLSPVIEHHRLDDVVSFLSAVRALLRGRGPLAVGFDARHVSREQLPALLSVVASEAVHGTIEAMDSPIRRIVLKRLNEGAARFADLMRACQLDDSPKLSFHLHRLDEAGLLRHTDELYRLTPKGREAAGTLERLEQEAAVASEAGFFFRHAPEGASGPSAAAPEAAKRPAAPSRRTTGKSTPRKK